MALEKNLKLSIQLATAVVMTVAGATLIFLGFWVNPTGEIHPSVLTGGGEMLTFAGAVFGIDYTYKYNFNKRRYGNPNQKNAQS